jgi:hypothetical protein
VVGGKSRDPGSRGSGIVLDIEGKQINYICVDYCRNERRLNVKFLFFIVCNERFNYFT